MGVAAYRALFQRLPWTSALRETAIRFLASRLARHGSLLYGQCAEDSYLLRRFAGSPPGFFVDVGCHHPERYSNTHRLYLAGWHGLNVDASEEALEACRRERKLDSFECAAVGPGTGMVEFAEFADGAYNGIWDPNATDSPALAAGLKPIRIRKVPVRNLTSIFEQHRVPARFGFLNIDIEGQDMSVIESLDFSRFQPDVIAVELHDFDPVNPLAAPAVGRLLKLGYRLAAWHTFTLFFDRGGTPSHES
jgi:FkbM family methyltransferase